MRAQFVRNNDSKSALGVGYYKPFYPEGDEWLKRPEGYYILQIISLGAIKKYMKTYWDPDQKAFFFSSDIGWQLNKRHALKQKIDWSIRIPFDPNSDINYIESAQLLKESYEFKRGKDSKSALGVGMITQMNSKRDWLKMREGLYLVHHTFYNTQVLYYWDPENLILKRSVIIDYPQLGDPNDDPVKILEKNRLIFEDPYDNLEDGSGDWEGTAYKLDIDKETVDAINHKHAWG